MIDFDADIPSPQPARTPTQQAAIDQAVSIRCAEETVRLDRKACDRARAALAKVEGWTPGPGRDAAIREARENCDQQDAHLSRSLRELDALTAPAIARAA